jgi:4-diphosphocytidyl-2-C-methyl-D-erythritol kinase
VRCPSAPRPTSTWTGSGASSRSGSTPSPPRSRRLTTADAAPAPDAEIAPAKVNLALHVTGRRADGYHLLDSVAAFPRLGDRLEAEAAEGLSLSLDGPFAPGLGTGGDNLVLRAAALLRPAGRGAALRLTKALPVAAGLGGGSADAAAALRLLARLWGVGLPAPDEVLALGADVPVCLLGRPARDARRGRGAVAARPAGVLDHAGEPGRPRADGRRPSRASPSRDNAPMGDPPAFADAPALFAWLSAAAQRPRTPARRLAPAIRRRAGGARGQPGCALARMSGSAPPASAFSRARLRPGRRRGPARAHPAWWVAAAPVEGASA